MPGGDELDARGGVAGVDGGVGRGTVQAQVGADTKEGLDGAEARMGGDEVADLLAFDSILLVGKREGGPQDAAHV